MRIEPAEFYDELAEHYHLIFENWDRSMERQAGILGPILESAAGPAPLSILDCACGIGTQAIGLARRGHKVTGSDLSGAAVVRARREAAERGLAIEFSVADMRDLKSYGESCFDAVVACDIALPHLLNAEDLAAALRQIYLRLRKNGVLLATIRDYDAMLRSRPAVQPAAFISDGGLRRIVHQVWDWEGDEYTVHLYITLERADGWRVLHFVSRYRALRRADLTRALDGAGFDEIRWMDSAETGLYQPVVVARRAH